jgi:ATP-dependent DNA helicase DinG
MKQYSKIINVGSLNKKNIEMTVPSLVEMVEKIINLHKDSKGIIYANNLLISDRLKCSKILIPRLKTLYMTDPGNNENILEKFRFNRYEENTIIMSPSGDLPIIQEEDECEFKIICKIPWGNIGNPEIAALAENNQKAYQEQMVHTFIDQFRTKSKNDQIAYILDETMKYFVLNKYSHLIPREMQRSFSNW